MTQMVSMSPDDWHLLAVQIEKEHNRIWEKYHDIPGEHAQRMLAFALQLQSYQLIASDMALAILRREKEALERQQRQQ